MEFQGRLVMQKTVMRPQRITAIEIRMANDLPRSTAAGANSGPERRLLAQELPGTRLFGLVRVDPWKEAGARSRVEGQSSARGKFLPF